jgi:flagellin
MRVNTNVPALSTQRTLAQTGMKLSRSIGRLSSGFRINRAADDAAGLGIANKLRADIRSMSQAARNAEQATSLLQVAEGAVQTVSQIVDRMKELATQAGSDNVDDAGRGRIKAEWDQLSTEIQKIVDTTKFQGKALLNGTFGNFVDSVANGSTALAAGTGVYAAALSGTAAATYSFTQAADGELTVDNGLGVTQTVTGLVAGKQSVVLDQFGITLQLDANFDETLAAGTVDGTAVVVAAGAGGGSFLVRSSGAYSSDDLISLSTLDLSTGASGLNISGITFTGNGSGAEWQAALTTLDGSFDVVSGVFGEIGAAQNRIDYATANVRTSIENIAAAESIIRDADMAAEMTDFTRFQILQQAGVAMLAQANAAPQLVLSLLQ